MTRQNNSNPQKFLNISPQVSLPGGYDDAEDAASQSRIERHPYGRTWTRPGAERRQQLDVTRAHATKEEPRQEQQAANRPPFQDCR